MSDGSSCSPLWAAAENYVEPGCGSLWGAAGTRCQLLTRGNSRPLSTEPPQDPSRHAIHLTVDAVSNAGLRAMAGPPSRRPWSRLLNPRTSGMSTLGLCGPTGKRSVLALPSSFCLATGTLRNHGFGTNASATSIPSRYPRLFICRDPPTAPMLYPTRRPRDVRTHGPTSPQAHDPVPAGFRRLIKHRAPCPPERAYGARNLESCLYAMTESR
ncbi:hypothetical protein VUR80DRAFT_3871 [Thermomyces stellatus]